MKGKIIEIRELYNEDLTINCYELTIHIAEIPDLKLGDCEVNQ